MLLVVDRIEDGICTCENLETEELFKFDKGALPNSTKEGDVLIYMDSKLTADPETTKERRKQIEELMRDIF